ncbi:hypothetical protein PRZ48_014973 [Zasmidium cellare]|uniref:AB hydrolase-1 domain-containing protein n=1 Tax=Zasmidium cellare TaxID=395010 RepID=A0ABR0DX99_ZASCE|nr:hypothetical protein PRZ48_014973 [Zasmidium cellare]
MAQSPESRSLPETLALKDGRTLAYARYGSTNDPKTIPVFYFNGTPGSRLECQIIDKAAQNLGIPLISTDRPGFGHSSFQPNRTLTQWAEDVLELADHLDIPKFGIVGISGGGPYALACLHELPRERLVAVTIVSSMYPWTFDTTGMMLPTRVLFWTARYSPWLVEKLFYLSMREILVETDKQKLIESIVSKVDSLPQPAADKEVMKRIGDDDDLYGAYMASPKEALRTSCQGTAWELHIFANDWGFELGDLDGSRLTIWHGGLDVNVPVGMSKKASQVLPEAKFRTIDSEGHMSLIAQHRHEILSELLTRL